MNFLYELTALVIIPGGLFSIAYYMTRGADQLKTATHHFYTNTPKNQQPKTDDKLGRQLNFENLKQLDKVINAFLIEKKPFLRQKYSLGEMATDLGVPLHHLSAFINHHYNVNFNELINKYRVSYSKLMIINDEWRYKKLSAIAAEAGFHNRNTFTTAFKKETGESPSEFLRRIKRKKASDQFLVSDIEKALMGKVPLAKVS